MPGSIPFSLPSEIVDAARRARESQAMSTLTADLDSTIGEGMSAFKGIASQVVQPLTGFAKAMQEGGISVPSVEDLTPAWVKAEQQRATQVVQGITQGQFGIQVPSVQELTPSSMRPQPASPGGPSLSGQPAAVSGPSGSAGPPGTGEIEGYIRHAAASRGIDPDVAMQVVMSEGGVSDPVRQSDYVYRGQREQSYGPLQLNVQGGVGSAALKAGIDPRNPAQWRQAVDFGLDEVARSGWGQWHGAARVGVGERQGIGTYRGPVPAPQAARGPQPAAGGARVVPGALPHSYWTSGGTHGGAPAADIFAALGSPIIAPVSGVSQPAVYPSGGNATIIAGDDGRYYYLAHGNVPFVGGRVEAGQPIGQVGQSGNARGTSPHLHYAIASNPSIFDQKNGSGDITGEAYWTTPDGRQHSVSDGHDHGPAAPPGGPPAATSRPAPPRAPSAAPRPTPGEAGGAPLAPGPVWMPPQPTEAAPFQDTYEPTPVALHPKVSTAFEAANGRPPTPEEAAELASLGFA